MSYLNTLSPQDKTLLVEEKVGVQGILKQTQAKFGLFQDYKLEVKNKIFTNISEFTDKFNFYVEFKNCYFLNTVAFYDIKATQIIFNNCFFDRDIKLLRNVEIGKLDLIVASVKGQVEVHECKINYGKWSVIDNSRVLINGGDFGDLIIGTWGGSILRELSFHLPKVTGLITVMGEKTKIERLDIFQYSTDFSLSIEDIFVNSMSIYKYRNEKSLRLSNVKAFETDKSSEFSIVESYLGKTEFYSFDFKSFTSVNLLDVHLVDCSFVNIIWPNNIYALKGRYVYRTADEKNLKSKIDRLEVGEYENITEKEDLENDKTVIEYYGKKREVLRQLKYALSKQGDVVNEQKFHSLEMRAYEKCLSYDEDFWTKYIIKFSYFFSDFGQSISRPLVGLLLLHFLLFTIVIVSGALAPLHFSIDNMTLNGFWQGFNEYFRLINPLRKADDTLNGGLIIIDLLMRIWSSYMIYNIIRASRRFIK